MKKIFFVLIVTLLFSGMSHAGEADVVKVGVQKKPNGTFSFSVTVFHGDTGWDHYANRWDVVGKDDVVYATRTLHHPHVGEQPFTRSLSGVIIPDSAKSITIRAHDLVHEYGGKVVVVDLP